MRLEPLHLGDRDRAMELYLTTFPAYERCDPCVLEEHSRRDDAEWFGIYDEGFLGMTYLMIADDVLYILYLAVVPGHRGSGIGSTVLRTIRETYPGRSLFLSIEPPDEECDNREQRISRKGFYERNGFREIARLDADGDHYIIMCHGNDITAERILSFTDESGLSDLFPGGMKVTR